MQQNDVEQLARISGRYPAILKGKAQPGIVACSGHQWNLLHLMMRLTADRRDVGLRTEGRNHPGSQLVRTTLESLGPRALSHIHVKLISCRAYVV